MRSRSGHVRSDKVLPLGIAHAREVGNSLKGMPAWCTKAAMSIAGEQTGFAESLQVESGSSKTTEMGPASGGGNEAPAI